MPAWLWMTLALLLAGAPASAQVDISGTWAPRYQEDFPDRTAGPALGDYTGLPLTDAARQLAESFDPARIALPEEQCRVPVLPSVYRGPLQFRVFEQRTADSGAIVAIVHRISSHGQQRTIWMDGRTHPDKRTPHTSMGFSTGRWEGARLVVTTTHLTQGWHRQNGVPMSDQATMTEHFVRQGDVLTRISIVRDPVYLTEALVRSEDFVLTTEPLPAAAWESACRPVTAEAGQPGGDVPGFPLVRNPRLDEFAKRVHLPESATRGGAATMYPEFMDALTQSR